MEEEKEKKKKTNKQRKPQNKNAEVKKKSIKKESEKKEKVAKQVEEIKEEKKREEIVQETKNTSDDNKYSVTEVIIVMILSIVLGLVLGAFITNRRNNNNLMDGEVGKVYRYIEKDYFGTYDKKMLNEATIEGILLSLNDPYAYYIYKDEYASYKEAIEGEFVGIGLEIFQNEEGYPQVVSVFEDGPCAKAGIKENDVMIKVDGEDIQNQDLSEVVSKIKIEDKKGEEITITVRRDGKELDFTLTREKVIDPSVKVNFMDNDGQNVAIISIDNFTNNTYDEFVNAYEKVKEEEVNNLILDLRNSSGINIENAQKIAEMFLDKGDVIYSIEDNNGTKEYKAEKKKEIELNTIILVNGCTSGMSELLTASLKENLDLTVIGSNTVGNNTIQSLYELEDGSYIRFTTARWLTPNGNSISEKGFEVDVFAEGTTDCNLDSDNALIQAFEVIKEKSI